MKMAMIVLNSELCDNYQVWNCSEKHGHEKNYYIETTIWELQIQVQIQIVQIQTPANTSANTNNTNTNTRQTPPGGESDPLTVLNMVMLTGFNKVARWWWWCRW